MKFNKLIFISIIPFLLGILSHLTCLFADFTYDDHPAVLEHPVSRLAQPLRRALFTDYWGLDITSFHSHGSFRPVTTASFALSSILSRFIQSINLYKEKLSSLDNTIDGDTLQNLYTTNTNTTNILEKLLNIVLYHLFCMECLHL